MGNLSLGAQGLTLKGKICIKLKSYFMNLKICRKGRSYTKKHNIHSTSVCPFPETRNKLRETEQLFFACCLCNVSKSVLPGKCGYVD